MHMADLKRRLWGGYAVVGGHIPLAVGLALAVQYNKEPRIVACFFGDGATNTGAFYTGLNIAAVWKLPLVVIVENNHYGMGTAVARASALTDLYKKACVFNMPALQIDGNDVVEVRDAVREVAARARSGGGPQFIEAVTYRYRGHSMGDPQRYRTKAEVEAAKGSDPIMRCQQRMLSRGLATEADLKQIVSQIEVELDEAVRFAETSPLPEPRDLYADVLIAE
jgi:pyruvate dehydrogenase E1 component alpha subunit